MQCAKLLGKHFDHQTQVGSKLVVQLGFAKWQRTKTSLIFNATKNLNHGNFNQLEVLWKRTCKHFGHSKNILEVIKGFTSNGLAMATYAFDFMPNLNINYWMSREVVERTSSTHASLLPNFLGDKKVAVIISKCLQILFSTSHCNQYCGYTTPKLSLTLWTRNLAWNFATRQSTTPKTSTSTF